MFNKTRLQGVIDGQITLCRGQDGTSYFTTIIKVARRNGTTIDSVPVLIPSWAINKGCSVKAGERVLLSGMVRTGWDKRKGVKKHMNLYEYITNLSKAESEEDINELEFIGNICKEPIFRKTPKNYELTNLVVAVNNKYKSYYIPSIVWQNKARFAKTLNIGDEVKITGTFHSRTYVKNLGETETEFTTFEISTNEIEETGRYNIRKEVV